MFIFPLDLFEITTRKIYYNPPIVLELTKKKCNFVVEPSKIALKKQAENHSGKVEQQIQPPLSLLILFSSLVNLEILLHSTPSISPDETRPQESLFVNKNGYRVRQVERRLSNVLVLRGSSHASDSESDLNWVMSEIRLSSEHYVSEWRCTDVILEDRIGSCSFHAIAFSWPNRTRRMIDRQIREEVDCRSPPSQTDVRQLSANSSKKKGSSGIV